MRFEPLISVIVPVYNNEKYIRVCIDSILRQRYGNIEIIIVNDGSTDGTAGIIDEYRDLDARVRTVHKSNGGVSSARNRGLEVARGEYVTFVDSDDFIDPGTYSEAVEVIELEGGDLDFVTFLMRVVNEAGIELSAPRVSGSVVRMHSNEAIVSDYLGSSDLSACNYVFKTDVVSGFSFDEGMRVNEDALFVFKVILAAERGARISKVFYNYLRNRESATHMSRPGDIEDRLKYISFVVNSVKDKYPSLVVEAKRRMLVNKNLMGLLLNSKLANDKEHLRLSRHIIGAYSRDAMGIYTTPKLESIFMATTYLPGVLFKFIYSVYRTTKERR